MSGSSIHVTCTGLVHRQSVPQQNVVKLDVLNLPEMPDKRHELLSQCDCSLRLDSIIPEWHSQLGCA